MSARPPITYLGTRSHFRSGPVKSYRALLSTAIQRRFGGSESWDSTGDSDSDRTFSSSNNNKRCFSSTVRSKVRPFVPNNNRTKFSPKKCYSSNKPNTSEEVVQVVVDTFNSKCESKVKLKPEPEATKSKPEMDLLLPLKSESSAKDSLPPTGMKTEPPCGHSVGLTTTQGLPSPASSTSETSDYQRSTPSPINEQEASSGSPDADAWLSDTRFKNEEPDPGLGDEGFSESISIQNSSRCQKRALSELESLQKSDSAEDEQTRNSTSSFEVLPSSGKVFQQLRVALEKIPTQSMPIALTDVSCLPGNKRVKKEVDDSKDILVKKLRLDSNQPVVKSTKPDLSDSPLLRTALSQGKITHYLAETKLQFNTALRKQKLDKILNLKTEPCTEFTQAPPLTVSCQKSFTYPPPPSPSPQVSVKCELTSDISTLDNSSADNSRLSFESSTPSSAKDESVFEIPLPIRFPLNRNNSHFPSEIVLCKWVGCGMEFESYGKLLDHLKTVHASCQGQSRLGSDEFPAIQFKCFWEGCKVYGKGSSSKSWLEKHVTNHGGNKPFQCIFEGCHLRFSTQSLLERHVNNHLKSSNSSANGQSHSGSGPTSTTATNSPSGHGTGGSEGYVRSIRKFANGRKLKYRRTIYSARIFDLFDIGVMTQVRQKLSDFEVRSAALRADKSGQLLDQSVVFQSQTLARRVDPDGQVRILQRWTPENLIDDEWTLVAEAKQTKKIQIRSLSIESRRSLLSNLLEGKRDEKQRSRKTKPQPRATAIS